MSIQEEDAIKSRLNHEFYSTHEELFKTDPQQYFFEVRKYVEESIQKLKREKQ